MPRLGTWPELSVYRLGSCDSALNHAGEQGKGTAQRIVLPTQYERLRRDADVAMDQQRAAGRPPATARPNQPADRSWEEPHPRWRPRAKPLQESRKPCTGLVCKRICRESRAYRATASLPHRTAESGGLPAQGSRAARSPPHRRWPERGHPPPAAARGIRGPAAGGARSADADRAPWRGCQSSPRWGG